MRYFFMEQKMWLFGFLAVLLLLICRRIYHQLKVRKYSIKEKEKRLNDLCEPFGYGYELVGDYFFTRVDAWQRSFGYARVYDELALSSGMIIDCLPVYFDYKDCTWLIEFWKGQYGITAGCEVGIYKAERILTQEEYKTALFKAVSDEELVDMEEVLLHDGEKLLSQKKRHWWLGAFSLGKHLRPEQLQGMFVVHFPVYEMREAFMKGLKDLGEENAVFPSGCKVGIVFRQDNSRRSLWVRIHRLLVHWHNGFWCRIYQWYTFPFKNQGERVVFLYLQLPFILRRMLKKVRKKRWHVV